MLRSIPSHVPHTLSVTRSRPSPRWISSVGLARPHPQRYTTPTLYPAPFLRHYSPLNPTPSQDSKLTEKGPPIPPLPPSRKHKVDLRPGPLKPKPSTSHSTSPTAVPNAPVKTQAGSQATPAFSLNQAKEEAQKDITEAEKHGIIPPPPPGANWFRATLHKAIELAKFYYRGVKLIFSRRREIAEIRARIKAGGSSLTRAEYRFIRTQKDDVNKVVPFLIIALLLEEVIPLIAIYAPFMLPSTCILPSQRARIEAKRAEKALNSSVNSKAIFAALKSQGSISLEALKKAEGAPTAVCSLLGLSSLGIDFLRIRRIRQHLQFIAEDDKLLIQDGAQLSDSELTETLAERGLFVPASTNFASKEKLLQWWLTSVEDTTSEDAVSRRLDLILSRQ